MRKILLFLFCSIISFTASAQWWRLKKREPHPAPIEQTELPKIKIDALDAAPKRVIMRPIFMLSDVALENMQSSAMRAAQHNMRYRVYGDASYNFSDLAQLYVKQGRYSEAKWYFLQSINLSRQQNNHKLTFSNLINLAAVKSAIGDFALAQQDLIEARNLATTKGWLIDLIEVEKKLSYIQHSRFATLRSPRYADELAAEN